MTREENTVKTEIQNRNWARKTVRVGLALIITFSALMVVFTGSPVFAESVTINWTAAGDDGSTGQASQYDIRYSTTPLTEANWDQANQVDDEPTPQLAGSSESYTIDSLQPGTTYYVALRVADESSISPTAACSWSG